MPSFEMPRWSLAQVTELRQAEETPCSSQALCLPEQLPHHGDGAYVFGSFRTESATSEAQRWPIYSWVTQDAFVLFSSVAGEAALSAWLKKLTVREFVAMD